MPFNPELKQGQELINEDLMLIFKCGLMGGMRKSKETNSLVIVSDHTRGIYKDRWEGNTLHYTGMGQKDNQDLNHAQNKTLNESDTNGIDVFLLEVFEPKKYIFQGKVKLASKPYQEKQKDTNGKLRDVWIFPLKLVDNNKPSSIPEEIFKKIEEKEVKQALKLPSDKLLERIETSTGLASTRETISKQYVRDQYVAAFALQRAKGKCQLCDEPAPFIKKDGNPYLEIHHIEWLSKGGLDSIKNTVALCPNCHRKMHILDLDIDKAFLLEKVAI